LVASRMSTVKVRQRVSTYANALHFMSKVTPDDFFLQLASPCTERS
jgi:hypothetical protein